MLDAKTNSEVLTLTEKQRDDIIASKKELGNGLYIESSDLDNEIKGWLGTK